MELICLVQQGSSRELQRTFVGKVATLLQREVCVSLVDVVTVRNFNLYEGLLESIGVTDPALGR